MGQISIFLITLIACMALAWLCSFISMAIETSKYDEPYGSVSSVGWMNFVLNLFLIVGITLSYLYNSLSSYKYQFSIFNAVSLAIATVSIDQKIYVREQSSQAVGAGFLILAIINGIWILYFTSEPDTFMSRLFVMMDAPVLSTNSYNAPIATHSHTRTSSAGGPFANINKLSRHDSNSYESNSQSGIWSNRVPQQPPQIQQPQPPQIPQPPMVAASPVAPTSHYGSAHGSLGNRTNVTPSDGLHQNSSGTGTATTSANIPDHELPQARCLYAYTASPEDPNEVSFVKNEILLVVDSAGKWWRVRKQHGQGEGIAPSNYLTMI